MLQLPPFILFFVGAFALFFVTGLARKVISIGIPVLGFGLLWQTPGGAYATLSVLDFELEFFRVDKLSLLFGYLFHVAALIAVTYSLHVKDRVQQVASILYAGSALGAVFAGDMITLFIFWELLALTSVFLIWARRTRKAYSAGIRYLVINIFSGLLLLAGVILEVHQKGSITFEFIGLESIGSYLILLAFGIKCAFPFFHNWLTDAYPESTPTGTVFLSAFTTKVAVYCLARAYPGTDILVYVGATMACFPIFFAVIENDLRRVLAYSLINQLGFMVVGVGIGTALAVNGAVAHAFTDVIFKGLLFMSMGAVLHMTNRINGSELGGLYKSMPKTTILCIVGAASISAFPLFSGFVSKSMVMTAAIKNGHDWVWLILLFASAGVFHHAGIKIPYFAFFAHDSGIRTKEPPTNMLIAMTIAATLCVVIGSFPGLLYQLLPFEVAYTPYDVTHVLTQLQLLFFSALAFVWLNLKGLYPPELPSINIDVEWVYRKLAPSVCIRALNSYMAATKRLEERSVLALENMVSAVRHYHYNAGLFAQNWPIERMVTWVVAILALYLVLTVVY